MHAISVKLTENSKTFLLFINVTKHKSQKNYLFLKLKNKTDAYSPPPPKF